MQDTVYNLKPDIIYTAPLTQITMFELYKLEYQFNELEPHINAETMNVHYSKHYQAYTDKLNAAVEGMALVNKEIEEILRDLDQVSDDIRNAVRNNGGGYYNHTFFWQCMSPDGGEPNAELIKAIEESFTSFENFKSKFEEAAKGVFGSGWAWLVKNENGDLEIMTTANQDTPISMGKTPLLTLDVWEHAYYLKYQNRRPDYISAWWNVVNWGKVEESYVA